MRLLTCVVVLWTFLGCEGSSSVLDQSVYQGCFSVLTLQKRLGHIIHPFVAEDCLKLCSGKGETHAGLDSINSICYCGEDLISQISRAEDTLCKPCKDDSNLFCGGVLKISLYKIEANAVSVSETEDHQEIKSEFGEEPLILLAGRGGIYSYNISTNDFKTVLSTDEPVLALDYNLGQRRGYTIYGEELFWFPLFREQPLGMDDIIDHEVARVGRCPTFTVDWLHNRIYYPDCYSHRIFSIDLGKDHFPEDVVVAVLDEGAWAYDMAVDPYKGLLFWSSGDVLWSCRLDGRGLRKVVPEFPVNKVSSLSLDLGAARVYFSGGDKHDKNTSRLYFASYKGSLSHPLHYEDYDGGSLITSFGIFDYHVYYIKSIDHNSSSVMSSKLEYNHRPSTYLHGLHQIERLRLVHPRLQSTDKTDACTNSNCSHLCVLESTVPKCYCPLHRQLDHDNKTCIWIPYEGEEEPLWLRIAVGLLLVVLVLMGAAVLMCICDKLWSQLHPTIVTLSIPGASSRTFTGHRRHDAENLI